MNKVLITYYSQTGNTEKIAKAISEEIKGDCDIDMVSIDAVSGVKPDQYKLVFVGSPIHAGGLAGPIKEFLETLPESGDYKIAGYITHSAPTYTKEDFLKGLNTLEETCGQKSIPYLGSFDCQGYLNPQIHDMVKKMKGFSDEEWADRCKQMEGHPNKEDEAKAKEFARSIVDSI
ncbi:MAG: flavodoxin [bacterium]|nr:flavodoxin [bacterium]